MQENNNLNKTDLSKFQEWKATQSVSVVIPTIGNALLFQAVQSVLSQTFPIAEILIVADTLDEIKYPENEKIKVLRTGPRAGGNVARQRGIEAAIGNVIALLDDDDFWLEDKTETQLREVYNQTEGKDLWLSSSRIVIKFLNGQETMVPFKKYEIGTPIVHYLFKKTGVRSHHGYIQSSAMMFSKELALQVPFDVSLKFHQDISWLVDISRKWPNLSFVQSWEGLVVKNSIDASVSKTISPEMSIQWANNRLSYDKRILGDFVLTQALFFAKRDRSVKSMIKTIISGIRIGKPSHSAICYSLITTMKSIITGKVKLW